MYDQERRAYESAEDDSCRNAGPHGFGSGCPGGLQPSSKLGRAEPRYSALAITASWSPSHALGSAPCIDAPAKKLPFSRIPTEAAP